MARLASFLLIILMSGSAADAADLIADLKRERADIRSAIADAKERDRSIEGGIVKSLIAARIEILMINDALLQQRIHAAEAGGPITISTSKAAPDETRASELEGEIQALERRIASEEAEEARYSGGLIKVMHATTVATSRMSLEMLRLEHLKAKYGIVWTPSLKEPSEGNGSNIGKWSKPIGETGSVAAPALPLVPRITNKRFQESNFRAGVYEDLLLFDIEWDGSQLTKSTRAVKGVLVFADVFGESRFRIRMTLDDPIKANGKLSQSGIGFDYNRFSSEHQWVRSTELQNMTFRFEPHEVLYEDGTQQKF